MEVKYASDIYDELLRISYDPMHKDSAFISMVWHTINFGLAFQHKPIRNTAIPLKDYGIRNNDIVDFIHYGQLYGGITPNTPIQERDVMESACRTFPPLRNVRVLVDEIALTFREVYTPWQLYHSIEQQMPALQGQEYHLFSLGKPMPRSNLPLMFFDGLRDGALFLLRAPIISEMTVQSLDVIEKKEKRGCVLAKKRGLREITVPLELHNISYNVVIERWMMKYGHMPEHKHLVESLRIQSGDSNPAYDEGMRVIVGLWTKYIKNLKLQDGEFFSRMIESLCQTIHWYKKCRSLSDLYMLTMLAYSLFTGKAAGPAVGRLFERLFGDKNNVQAQDAFTTGLSKVRSVFEEGKMIGENPFIKKIMSIYSFLLVQGFLSKFGLELSDEDYSRVEQRALLSAYSSKRSFLVSVFDLSLYIVERLNQWRITGEFASFIYSTDACTLWMTEADRLLNLAPFTGNLEPHGTSYFSFIADLRDAIEKGECYAKYTNQLSGVSPIFIKNKLKSLQMLQNTEITRRAACRERKAPFGILIFGGSSVAKSCFSKMIFNYFGSLYDLDRSDEFRYLRNALDQYWSNFDSSKWCIQIDDIAFRLPSKCNEVDPSLVDLVFVSGNISYCPPQAAIEDKGKTPVMARLLIATTNCPTLNAQEYFWCPLAIQRRLPFVVGVEPKKEYLHENGKFIDPVKIHVEVDSFPDLWNITLYKVVPTSHGTRDYGKLEEICQFTDVNDFLAEFGKACKVHDANQEKAMQSDTDMLKLGVCKTCLRPTVACKCNLEIQSNDSVMCMVDCMLSITWIWNLIVWSLRFEFMRRLIVCRVMRTNNTPRVYSVVERLHNLKSDSRLLVAMGGFAMLAGGFAAYNFMNFSNKKKEVKKIEKGTRDDIAWVDMCGDDLEICFHNGESRTIEMSKVLNVQGNKFSTTEQNLVKEETTNVWYDSRTELSSFDLPKATRSLAGAKPEFIRELFAQNAVGLVVRTSNNYKRSMRGIYVKGQYLLTNGHAFRADFKTYDVEILRSKATSGVRENFKFTIKRSDIVFHPKKDLCIVRTASAPPMKDITKFWVEKEIPLFEGIELIKELDGDVKINAVHALDLQYSVKVEDLPPSDYYIGVSTRVTEDGTCGSILIGNTPQGYAVCGIHTLGKDHSVGFLAVFKSDIDFLLSNEKWVIQGGGSPQLSSETVTKVLTPVLHHKSIFRFIDEGSANLYGTLEGFRPRPRSKVCATPLQDVFLTKYNRSVEYGQPKMDGWEPWRKNVIEMVRPTANMDWNILSKCSDAFIEDIVSSLPKGWEADLVFLSKKASLNGLPEVKYIDSINRKSSMGFPWCCSKKGFLEEDPSELYPDGVDFPQEVWDRFDNIVSHYENGERAYPVFNGHLKDEATPLKKCKIGKTRLFTAAPIDWSLVVRSRLLTFVRLVQKNKFVFEAGPGLVTQSDEWSKVYDYLTPFGTSQIIAGDYGKFDKHMISNIILEAFRIMATVYERAGFDDGECRQIMAIGYDTAFSVCNINGDLVEFFGTNPSGHPLTVVVNSLVNSLYMRYAFVLSTNLPATDFKKNVRLFTYGDDNIMGVSPDVPDFNHCNIQQILSVIGVEYTMADKEAESVPYIDISQTQFLKRTWRWDDDVGTYLAPLDENSIIKSLTVWVPSGTLPASKQMVQVISSANSEYFFFGKKKFTEMHSFFEGLLATEPYCHYVNESTLPNWDQLVERFHRSSDLLAKS